MFIIFILIGIGFSLLSTQVIYQILAFIIYNLCSLFCFLIAYALIYQDKQNKQKRYEMCCSLKNNEISDSQQNQTL